MTAESEVYVHVLDVTFFGEYGWTSVHRTYDGAWARLEEKVDEYDARAAFDAELKGQPAAGAEGDVITWGISYLPVLA